MTEREVGGHVPPPVATISRQLGSGGAQVGRDLAARLGVPCYDREILHLAAERLQTAADVLEEREEKVPTLWQSVLESYAPGGPEGIYFPPPLNLPSDGELRDAEAAIIAHLGRTQSAVIVGRGGSQTLRDHPRHLSVFLHAGLAFRRQRVQEQYEVSAHEAEELIERSDRGRARYHSLISRRDWEDARQYSLCLDVAPLGVDGVVEVLYGCWQRRFGCCVLEV